MSSPLGQRIAEVAGLFLRLGFTAFGGPAAHVALMEDEVVVRRQWLDRQHFLDLVSAINFIPGPNSTELAIHLGLIRAGWIGLIVAGACFIGPAMMIILPLAWMYVRFGQTPQVQPILGTISAAIIAIIAAAAVRFGRTSLRDLFTWTVAILSAVLALVLRNERRFPPEIAILALAAIAGAARAGISLWPRAMPCLLIPIAAEHNFVILAIGNATITATASIFFFFLRVGATLFGSGYVLISYLHAGLVEQRGWLNDQQLLDAVAVGQITPGPLLTTATFIGYFLGDAHFGGGVLGGIGCGVLATAGIFLPSFAFVALLAPALNRLRQNPIARGALDAMNAAVVALIVVVCVQLAGGSFYDPVAQRAQLLHIVVAATALAVLLATKLNATWIVAGAAMVGLVAQFYSD